MSYTLHMQRYSEKITQQNKIEKKMFVLISNNMNIHKQRPTLGKYVS